MEGRREGVGLGGRGFEKGAKGELGGGELVVNFEGFGLVNWCCWDFGLGAKKSNFLEIGSRRGFVPRWMGGNNFRQEVSGSYNKLQQDNLLLQEVIHNYCFTLNSSYDIYRYTM
jgi:hypothetical protein